MGYQLLEVSAVGLAYICLGGFVVAFSMFPLLMKEKFYINEVVLGTAFGVLMGPHVANVFDPRSWGERADVITLEVTRVVLAIGLFMIGVELPRSYMAKHVRGLFVMVVPTMAIGWVIVAGIIRGLFPHLTFLSSLAIAACLTPTDPIICAAIVGGKYAKDHVDVDLRHILSAESAANDGMAYPFLTISLYLILDSTSRQAVSHWVLIGCLYQVILGVVIGAIFGFMFSYLMKFSHKRGFIGQKSYVVQYLASAILTIGIVGTIGSDDLLAAFAAGTTIAWDGDFNKQADSENQVFSPVIDFFLNCGCFMYIGAWLPFASFNNPSLGISPWRLVLLFLAILAFRRIPAILALYRWIPEIKTWREALFSGHYGPMGVGAIFISSLALHKLPKSHGALGTEEEILAASLEPIVAFVVLCSIIIHGLSIPVCELGKRVFIPTETSTLTARCGEPALTADIRSIDHEIIDRESSERPVVASQRTSFTHVSMDLEKGG